MKTLFLCLGLLLPVYNFAQDCMIPTENGDFHIQEVVQMDSHSIHQLYRNSLLTLTEILKTPEEHIEMTNWEEGIILARFAAKVERKTFLQHNSHHFYFSFRLEFKDQRYRMTINYLEHVHLLAQQFLRSCPNKITSNRCGGALNGIPKKEWNKIRCSAVDKVAEFKDTFYRKLSNYLGQSNW